jgi:chromosome segregation ATPase
MDEITKLSGVRLKNFFISVCKTAKAVEDKKRQKADVARHLEKIKSLYTEKGIDRKRIEDEMGALSSRMNEIIDKEKQMSTRQEDEDALLRKLQSRIEQIGVTPLPQTKEIEDFRKTSKFLQENISKIRELTHQMAEEESERLGQVEEKVNREFGMTEHEIKEIDEKLVLLENEYKRLRGAGKNNKRIEKIGSKIKKQKEVLNKFRRS